MKQEHVDVFFAVLLLNRFAPMQPHHVSAIREHLGWNDDNALREMIRTGKSVNKPNAALTGGEAVPSNGVVGTESPHPMLCFQHGGSEACEAENHKHGFTCPKCSNAPRQTAERSGASLDAVVGGIHPPERG